MTDRHRQTNRHRRSDRQTVIQTDIEGQTYRETDIERQTDRCTDTDRQTDQQTHIHIYSKRQTDIERKADKETMKTFIDAPQHCVTCQALSSATPSNCSAAIKLFYKSFTANERIKCANEVRRGRTINQSNGMHLTNNLCTISVHASPINAAVRVSHTPYTPLLFAVST